MNTELGSMMNNFLMTISVIAIICMFPAAWTHSVFWMLGLWLVATVCALISLRNVLDAERAIQDVQSPTATVAAPERDACCVGSGIASRIAPEPGCEPLPYPEDDWGYARMEQERQTEKPEVERLRLSDSEWREDDIH